MESTRGHQCLCRRRLVALVAAALCATLALLTAAAAANATTETFYYTGGEQTFVVPSWVYSIQAVAVGGAGGSTNDATGGEAARVTGTLNVTPGETLYIEVGGSGQSEEEGGVGGFNGGGSSGRTPRGGGAGGGGASDVRTVSRFSGLFPDPRLLIAGGGGGAGGNGECGAAGGAGGAAGEDGQRDSCSNGGGTAGTASGGGAGTDGGDCGTGQAGELGQGGSGSGAGYAGPGSGGQAYCKQSAGGGGGGGLYGGAGGSGGDNAGGGGGGGGSSLVPNGGSESRTSEPPQIQITFTSHPGPQVTGNPVSGVTQTSGTLNALVNPTGEQVTDCHFEYGTSAALGTNVLCENQPGSVTNPVDVTANIAGLQPNTTYYFRISATNAAGTNESPTSTFTTLPNPPAIATTSPTDVAHTSATLEGTVNPEGSYVTDCHFEYGPSPSYGSSAPCTPEAGSGYSPVAVTAPVTGLEAGTTYYYRLVATSSGGTSYTPQTSFETPTSPPITSTEGATNITQATATVAATVNPEGEAITNCRFDYGATSVTEASTPCTSFPGSGRNPVAVSAELTGLLPNTQYRYRISATNGTGTARGDEQTFTTLPEAPVISGEHAASIGRTTAVLEVDVNPNGGGISSCEFEYGTTTTYGESAPCSSLPGAQTTPVSVTTQLSGLTSAQEYHYRLVASNAGGATYGTDHTFTSEGEPPTVSLGAASWSQPTQLAGGPTLVSVACAPETSQASGLCMAISSRTAYTASSPSGTYASTGLPDTGQTVVCFTTSSCISVGGGYVDIASISGSNASWQSNPANDGSFNSLACGSISFCIHTQESGEEIIWTSSPTNPNVSWNSVGNVRYAIHGLSCAPTSGPSSGLCVAVGQSGHVEQSTAPSGNWSYPSAPNGESGRTLTGVSCPTTTYCAAVDNEGGLITTTNPAGGAGTWTAQQVDQGRRLEAISCMPGTTTCVSVDNDGYAIISEGAHAGPPIQIDGGRDLVSISCPDANFCEAVDSSGYVIYTTGSSGGSGLGGVTAGPGAEEATASGTVNPNGQQITSCQFEYGPDTNYGSTAACATLPGSGRTLVQVEAKLTSLEPRPLYHYRLTATNASGEARSTDGTFKLRAGAPEAPAVNTEAASSITDETAGLHAAVNPNGERATSCTFEYGQTASYSASVPCSTTPSDGESPVAVTAVASSLRANTTYHYRISAANATGTSYGEDQTFRTLPYPPTIQPIAASAITQTSLQLNATVNPNGGEVSDCIIEYGTSQPYSASIPCSPQPGEGTNPVAITGQLNGLRVNTSYDYRVVATNPGGTSYEPNQTVRTLPNPPIVETSSYISSTSTLTGAVNPSGGETTCSFEYGNTHLYGHTIPCATSPGDSEAVVEVFAQPTGLTPGQTYHFRLVASNAGGTNYGADQTFTAAAGPPTVQTSEATAITQSTARLTGTVNPNASEITECELEYGPTAGYGATTPCSTLPGSGNTAVPVSAQVGNLSANTTYHFRVLARNASRTSYGGDQTFKTLPNPPVVFTGNAAEITDNSAVIHGQVDPNGAEVTECTIAYGPTTHYGSNAPCEPLPGAGTSPVSASALITGLAPSTEYHYRMIATSTGGTGEGTDETFTTLPPGRAPTISKLSTKKGPAAGGTELTITGTGFTGTTAVRFGTATAASFTVVSTTSITVESPPGTAGKTEITVTTPSGTSGVSKAAAWTYEDPTVTTLIPNHGPRAGGNQVTIHGSGFAPGANTTTFTFGKAAATTVICASTTTCTFTAPASSKAREVDVVAAVGKAKGKKNPASDSYLYE